MRAAWAVDKSGLRAARARRGAGADVDADDAGVGGDEQVRARGARAGQAEAAFTEAIRLNPDNAEAHHRRAGCDGVFGDVPADAVAVRNVVGGCAGCWTSHAGF